MRHKRAINPHGILNILGDARPRVLSQLCCASVNSNYGAYYLIDGPLPRKDTESLKKANVIHPPGFYIRAQ